MINENSFELTHMAWRELTAYDDDEKSIKSHKGLLKLLKEDDRTPECIKNIRISNKIKNDRVKKLLAGYALLDITYNEKRFVFERIKMWELFEDLNYEIFREIIGNNHEITRVDKLRARWPVPKIATHPTTPQ